MKSDERYRILYVDDNEQLLDLCKIYVGKNPEFTLLTASSVEDGFEILLNDRVDIIISDNDMPGVTGIEFLKRVRSNSLTQEIPFIIFTGRSREEIVIEALNNKADFYLQKGTDINSQYTELLSVAVAAYKKKRFEKMILKIYDFTIGIVENSDLKKNLELILSSMVDIFHVNASHISLIEDGVLHHFVSVGDISEDLKNVRLPLGYGLGGLVVKGGKPYAINNYEEEDNIRRTSDDVPAKDGIITCAAAPIKFGVKTCGVIYLHRYFEKNFSQKDLRTLSLYANLVAIAFKTAQEDREDRE
ncbi:MAG: response regulator [Candidatus Pacebacteria bacterium]|nr:response regulator [Candidatus Paceibacterota bacterium]